MSSETRTPDRTGPLRVAAERQMADSTPIDLSILTPDEIQALVYELEVHKIELRIQNEQLSATQREALESSERYQRLYDSAPIGYLTLDPDGVIVEANRSIALTFGSPRATLIGRKLSAFVAPHCQDRWHLARRDMMDGRARLDVTLATMSSDGHAVDLHVVGTTGDARSIGSREVQLALIDVTEVHRTERALQAALTAASLAEQRERRKLAADLHDDAGQLLALASMKLHALSESIAADHAGPIAELIALLDEIRARISSLSFQLSPPLLHDVGLVAAVQWLAEQLAKSHGLSLKIVEEHEIELDEVTRITFYRAIRELLLNVVKHSGVKQARLRISCEGTMTRIAVEDSGVGMTSRAKGHGFGLMALRDRIEQLGGSLDIHMTQGTGTTIVVSLPTPVCDRQREGGDDDPDPAGR